MFSKPILFLFLVAMSIDHSLAAGSSLVFAKDIYTHADLSLKPIPQWRDGTMTLLEATNGALIHISVVVGQETSRLTFAVPGAKHVTVRDYNRGADGAIALCGSLTDGDGRSAAYVAWIAATGQATHVIRTSPFVAMHVALAADGTIWTQGSEMRPPKAGEPDAAVFRQFDRAGNMLRKAVPQPEIAESSALITSTNLFEVVSGKVIWYSSASRQYIEIAAAGGAVVKVNDLPLPNNESLSGSAIGPQGELFATSANGSTWSLSRLDLPGKRWVPITSGSMSDRTAPVYRPTLVGSDGEHLVVLGKDGLHLKFLRLVN